MPKTLTEIAPESVLLAGAGSAILLQLANPAIGYGVARHSDFVNDPLKRLHGTLSYIYALSNGTVQQRRTMQAQVQRAHLPVKSAGEPQVPSYHASDPKLQLWVTATLYVSASQTYDAVFPALSAAEAESVYQSYSVLGTALGMPAPLWPATRADFSHYWDQELQQLSVDETVRQVATDLLAAKNAPLWVKVLMPLARFLTAGMLPPQVRGMFALPWSPRKERNLSRLFRVTGVFVRFTPRRLRHAPMHYYLNRVV